MSAVRFEPFREWVDETRRRKGSKRTPKYLKLVSARAHQPGGRRVDARLPVRSINRSNRFEFKLEQRSPGVSWLNIKQLSDPQISLSRSSLQARYKP